MYKFCYQFETHVFDSSMTTVTRVDNCGHSEGEAMEEVEVYDVLILGAGLAGLGAARELSRCGRRICVLEGQHRPGGRVLTVKLNRSEEVNENNDPQEEITVEAGAQWIHGKENDLYRIAAAKDLIALELGEEACGDFIRSDGTIFGSDLVKKIDFKIGEILQDCEQFVKNSLKKDISIRAYLEEKFEDYLQSNPDIDPVAGRQLLDWHIRFQIIDNSCWDLRDVGVNDWGKYSFNGESCQAHINVKNGFEKVLDVIIQEIGKGTMNCNQEVVKINWGKEISKVECSNGKEFFGKFLIVTFPIGILKQDKLFNPELPVAFREAIESMGYGTINKICLKYKEPFWDTGFRGIQFLWADKEQSIPNWIKSMTGFDVMEQNTLVGWVGGSGAIDMEKMDSKQVVQDCVDVLRKLLKRTVPLPSHFYW